MREILVVILVSAFWCVPTLSQEPPILWDDPPKPPPGHLVEPNWENCRVVLAETYRVFNEAEKSAWARYRAEPKNWPLPFDERPEVERAALGKVAEGWYDRGLRRTIHICAATAPDDEWSVRAAEAGDLVSDFLRFADIEDFGVVEGIYKEELESLVREYNALVDRYNRQVLALERLDGYVLALERQLSAERGRGQTVRVERPPWWAEVLRFATSNPARAVHCDSRTVHLGSGISRTTATCK
jgi:hypothetical protein